MGDGTSGVLGDGGILIGPRGGGVQAEEWKVRKSSFFHALHHVEIKSGCLFICDHSLFRHCSCSVLSLNIPEQVLVKLDSTYLLLVLNTGHRYPPETQNDRLSCHNNA